MVLPSGSLVAGLTPFHIRWGLQPTVRQLLDEVFPIPIRRIVAAGVFAHDGEEMRQRRSFGVLFLYDHGADWIARLLVTSKHLLPQWIHVYVKFGNRMGGCQLLRRIAEGATLYERRGHPLTLWSN